MVASGLDFLGGWSVGDQYAAVKNKENEVKQGKNCYLASLCQSVEFIDLSVLANYLLSSKGSGLKSKVFFNVVPLASLVAHVFFAAVKHEDYETIAANVNLKLRQSKVSWIPFRLPEKLDHRTVRITNFLAEHSGDITQTALIVGSSALIVFGNFYFGMGVASGLTYHMLDQKGVIPRKISLFIETYRETIFFIGAMVTGTMIMRVYTLATVMTAFSPAAIRFIHHKVDQAIHHFFSQTTPLLSQMDAPVLQKSKLSFDEMKHILESNELKVNPAHCTKMVASLSDLPSSHDFDVYVTLFDQVDWSKKYEYIKEKLRDDDVFIGFLQGQLPVEVAQSALKERFDLYLDQAAAKQGLEKTIYVVQWLRGQLINVVDALKGIKRVKGSRSDLEEGIGYYSKILPHLQSLQHTSPVDFEDLLLRLSVRAGDYCALQVKLTGAEETDGILLRNLASQNPSFAGIYEFKLASRLKDLRRQIVEYFYTLLTQAIHMPRAIAGDVHGFEIYRKVLSLGFYPLTDSDRANLHLSDFILWETYIPIRHEMYNEYDKRLDSVFEEAGEVHFGNYLRQTINDHPHLLENEKQKMMDMYLECNDGQWTRSETRLRFHRLALVMMGVLNCGERPRLVVNHF